MAYEADAIIGGKIPTEAWPKTPKLKLFQIPWTGYDFCSPDSMPLGIPVSNFLNTNQPLPSTSFVQC